MRGFAALGITALMMSALGVHSAEAEPAAKPTTEKKTNAVQKPPAPAPSVARHTTPFGTINLMTLRPRAAQTDRPVNLFPPNVFGRGLLASPTGGKSERRNGLSLGDDGDWRVHAAQVGAMAVGWLALVGLCSGGKCMIPDKWVPGPFQRSQQVVPSGMRARKSGVRNLGR